MKFEMCVLTESYEERVILRIRGPHLSKKLQIAWKHKVIPKIWFRDGISKCTDRIMVDDIHPLWRFGFSAIVINLNFTPKTCCSNTEDMK